MNILFSDFIGESMVKISCFILLQGLFTITVFIKKLEV